MPTILEAGNLIARMEGRPSKGRTRFGNHRASERSLEGFRDLVLRLAVMYSPPFCSARHLESRMLPSPTQRIILRTVTDDVDRQLCGQA